MPLVGAGHSICQVFLKRYIELVDFIGRKPHPGKRGKIAAHAPRALTKLGLAKSHWTKRVKGIVSGYWRVVGGVEELIDKAKEIRQRTLRWYWLCADFGKRFRATTQIILPRLRLALLILGFF